jgi:hypothetical protein
MSKKVFWKSTTFHGLFLSLLGLIFVLASRKGLVGNQEVSDILELIGYAAELLGLPYAGYGRIATKGEKVVFRKTEPPVVP